MTVVTPSPPEQLVQLGVGPRWRRPDVPSIGTTAPPGNAHDGLTIALVRPVRTGASVVQRLVVFPAPRRSLILGPFQGARLLGHRSVSKRYAKSPNLAHVREPTLVTTTSDVCTTVVCGVLRWGSRFG